MITTDHHGNLVELVVFGDFTLADFEEFERLVLYKVKFGGAVNLLVDLSQMADFTIDVALEELKFSREHDGEFGRIAVVTDNQWVAWSAWLSQLFVSADVRVFADTGAARDWLTETGE